jgi:sec-independent protein translocase protein TatA
MIGTTEILIIGGVVVLLFGATAIPKFAKSIGKAKKEFNKGLKDGEEESTPENDNEPQNEQKEE